MVKGNILLPSPPLQPRHIPYAIRYANQHQLTLPLYHTNSFKHPFLPSAITCWNDLPLDTTKLSFPAMFKTHNGSLISNYCLHISFPCLCCWFTLSFPLCLCFFFSFGLRISISSCSYFLQAVHTGTNLSL